MITVGNKVTEELISVELDEAGNPVSDAAGRPLSDETKAALVPLVKIAPPDLADDKKSTPVLVWFEDRVERQWQVVDVPADELSARARSSSRAALRAQWEALPAYIRGPYRDKFEAANRLLDEGDDDAAVALIEYAAPAPDFDAAQLATFAQVKASMKAGIEALPGIA